MFLFLVAFVASLFDPQPFSIYDFQQHMIYMVSSSIQFVITKSWTIFFKSH